MPYKELEELPKQVKNVLPNKAQHIYISAYNNAWGQYEKPGDRKGDDSRDEVAHKVAWSAVKNSYEKEERGTWQ